MRGRAGQAGRGGAAHSAFGQGGGVAVEHDGGAGERAAIGDLHAGDAAVLALDPGGGGGEAEGHAQAFGQRGKGRSKVVHASLYCPDAPRLGPPDERQDGGGSRGPAADIGGVAGEELDQAGVAELGFQPALQGQAGKERGPERGLAQGGAGDGGEVGSGRLHHGGVEGLIEGLGGGVEFQEGRRLARAGERADVFGILGAVGGEVERG